MNATFFKKKKDKNIAIKKEYGLLQKNKPLGLIKITNKDIIRDLRDGLLTIPAGFIIELDGVNKQELGKNIIAIGNIKNEDLIGFDFIVCDNNISQLEKYLKNGIVPIIQKNNHFSKILKEFNPLKNEGNSFFYENESKWDIFGTIIKYIENYKFPFDNKNLVKNTLEIN